MPVHLVRLALTLALVAPLALADPAVAADYAEKIRVETLSVGLQPGMDPGLYVCAGGHLHIKATVMNQAGVPVGPVKVQAKAFDAAGALLGTTTGVTKQQSLAPGQTAPVEIEFLTVTGSQIQRVKRHELNILEAPARP